MTPKRPWERPEFTDAPSPDLDFATADDAAVRAYCLQRTRAFLARAEDADSGISSSRQLEIASRYAMIAEAFRPDR